MTEASKISFPEIPAAPQLLINISPVLIPAGQPLCLHMSFARELRPDLPIVIEVISGTDEIVERQEVKYGQLKDSTEKGTSPGRYEGVTTKVWSIGPLSRPDRYTIRAAIKGSDVYAIASAYVATEDSREAIGLFDTALEFRAEASSLVKNGSEDSIRAAVKPLKAAAEIYSRLDEHSSSALTWRDLCFVFMKLKDSAKEDESAERSLDQGLILYDPDNAYRFLRKLTERALEDQNKDYPSIVHAAFRVPGPALAYAAASPILEGMAPAARALYANTVLAIFPKVNEGSWSYIYDKPWDQIHKTNSYDNWAVRLPNDDVGDQLEKYSRPTKLAEVLAAV